MPRRIITDLSTYAEVIVDELNGIKDRRRDVLTHEEIDSLNDACNLIYNNRKEIKKL